MLKGLKKNIESDHFRYGMGMSFGSKCLNYKRNRLFRLTFWFRVAQEFNKKNIFLLAPLTRWYYHSICRRCNIDFPISVKVGYGLKIVHGMGLVINSKSEIGDNVMLCHNMTLATEKNGAPKIGDRVRFAPGAVVVGGVNIGNDCVIGANCVVLTDVPSNSVAVGIPNKNIAQPFKEFQDRNYYVL